MKEFAVVYLNGFGYREIVAIGTEEELSKSFTIGLLNPAPAGEFQDDYGYDEQLLVPLDEAEELVRGRGQEQKEAEEEKSEFQELIEKSMS